MSVKMFDDIVDRERHGPKPALGRLSLFRTVGSRLRGSGTLKRIRGDDFGQATRYPRVMLNCFSIHPATGATLAGRWTLKQVQDDGFG